MKYTLYHIKGVKWGCTQQPIKTRLKQQGYTLDDLYEKILEDDVDNASELEKELNIRDGYPWNNSQDYRVIAKARKHFTAYSAEKISKKLKEHYKNGRIKQDKSIFKTKEYREKQSKNMKQVLSDIEIRKKISQNGRRKYTDKQIQFMRNSWAPTNCKTDVLNLSNGKYSTGQLAKMFNTCRRTISRIIKYEAYPYS